MFPLDMYPGGVCETPLVVKQLLFSIDLPSTPLVPGNLCWWGNFAIEEYLDLTSQRQSEFWRYISLFFNTIS